MLATVSTKTGRPLLQREPKKIARFVTEEEKKEKFPVFNIRA